MKERTLPSESPAGRLCQALERRDAPAAQAILDSLDRLRWIEVSRCAPLTFRWSPELLEQILDKGPRREIYCHRAFPMENGWELETCASLLTAAAALNDLPAVELLLARGYAARAPFDKEQRCDRARLAAISSWYHLIAGTGIGTSVAGWCHLTPPGRPKQFEAGPGTCSPLSAAVWCGAKECALRLLKEEPLSGGVRAALCRNKGNQAYRDTVQAVCQALGKTQEELHVWPVGLLYKDPDRFLACLPHHPEWLDLRMVREILEEGKKDWLETVLPLLPSRLVARAVLEMPRNAMMPPDKVQHILTKSPIRLPVDRNTVPPNTKLPALLLPYMEVTGSPPEGGLSGLAAALLHNILSGYWACNNLKDRQKHQLLYHPRTAQILAAEDGAMAAAYIRWWPDRQPDAHWPTPKEPIPPQAVSFILVMLGLREEKDYVL